VLQGEKNVIDAIEKRDQELRSSLVQPTMAERDRRTLLGIIRRQNEAMREALTYLKNEEPPTTHTAAAIESLTYTLEQG
jgi:hypothetical protein